MAVLGVIVCQLHELSERYLSERDCAEDRARCSRQTWERGAAAGAGIAGARRSAPHRRQRRRLHPAGEEAARPDPIFSLSAGLPSEQSETRRPPFSNEILSEGFMPRSERRLFERGPVWEAKTCQN